MNTLDGQGRTPQFFETPKDNAGKKRLVNLNNVTNIAFVRDSDEKREVRKIIFNMDCPVNLKGSDKVIPDYVYAMYDTDEGYDTAVSALQSLVAFEGWIAPVAQNFVSRIINPEKVNFVTTDPKKDRLIVVLKTPITISPRGYNQFNPDFMFFDFDTPDEMEKEYDYIKTLLGDRYL